MNLSFKLFANCTIVKGAARGIICDLQRGDIFFFTLAEIEIIEFSQNMPLEDVLKHYQYNPGREKIEYLFKGLYDNDLGFWTDEPFNFPPVDLSWDEPSLINNAIIDLSEEFNHDFDYLFNQLETVGCRDLQIRGFHPISLSKIEEIVKKLENRRIKSVEFFAKYDANLDYTQINTLATKYQRIKSIIIHSSPGNKIETFKGLHESALGNVLFIEEAISSAACCGVIEPEYFTFSIPSYTESQQHNSCLNRKVGIDGFGNIKNCPSLMNIYGNIYDLNLVDVVRNADFTNVWSINKDKINVCKDCEFRYICTDCRAFLKDDASLEKPFKCNYNPYIAEWES